MNLDERPSNFETKSLYVMKLSMGNVEMKIDIDAIKDKQTFINKMAQLCLTLTT